MTDLNTTENAALCPRCAQANHCAVAAGAAPQSCWCMSATLDPARTQPYVGQRRCLCPVCGKASTTSETGNGNDANPQQ